MRYLNQTERDSECINTVTLEQWKEDCKYLWYNVNVTEGENIIKEDKIIVI